MMQGPINIRICFDFSTVICLDIAKVSGIGNRITPLCYSYVCAVNECRWREIRDYEHISCKLKLLWIFKAINIRVMIKLQQKKSKLQTRR